MNADKLLKALAVILTVALAGVVSATLREPNVQVGDSAPHFSIVSEKGRVVTPENFGGKLLVLNFWATWCPPCVQEMPSLNEFSRQLAGSGVVVLAISVDRDEAKYKRFIERFGLEFELARDAEAAISASYGTTKYPETYVINSRGEVLEKFIGEENWADPRLIERIKKLL
ncbi:MAG: TlpA disulfide reductase family protein [Bryobacteraceae bacterium]|nr:TlpA disulfide reductase family protein [Bryobacteraceae bacterium]